MTLINIAQRNLDFLTTSYNYLTWVLPIVVVAPEYFQGNVEMGVVSQASSAFGHILDDLSIVVNSFTDVSKFSAGIDRLYSFLSAIMALNPSQKCMGSLLSVQENDATSNIGPVMANTNVIRVTDIGASASGVPSKILSIEGLNLATPDNKRLLVENLNVSLNVGTNLLIVGASGSGKSSLLRAIAAHMEDLCTEPSVWRVVSAMVRDNNQ